MKCNLCQFNVGNFSRRTREREKLMRHDFEEIPAVDQSVKNRIADSRPSLPALLGPPTPRPDIKKKKKTPCGSRPVLPDRWRPFANISQKGNDREAWLTRPMTPTRLITCIDAGFSDTIIKLDVINRDTRTNYSYVRPWLGHWHHFLLRFPSDSASCYVMSHISDSLLSRPYFSIFSDHDVFLFSRSIV